MKIPTGFYFWILISSFCILTSSFRILISNFCILTSKLLH